MSNDHPPSHDGPPDRQRPIWPWFLLGMFVVAPAAAFLSVATGGGAPVVLLVVVVGSFALLFQRDPMLRGIGAGVLTAGALALIIFFIACYTMLQDLD